VSDSHTVWERFLAKHAERFIGGDLELVESGLVFRGPIRSMQLMGDQLIIRTHWTARANVLSVNELSKWEVDTRTDANRFAFTLGVFDVVMTHAPKNIGRGRVRFVHTLATVTLHPKGGSKLDRAQVAGL
jgi:hypothetical protein